MFTYHTHRVQELCESRGGPGLPVLMSLTVSVDVKQQWTVRLRHWSQFVPNMSIDIRGHEVLLHQHIADSVTPVSHYRSAGRPPASGDQTPFRFRIHWLSGIGPKSSKLTGHTASIAFRHRPCRKDVNQCLEFELWHDSPISTLAHSCAPLRGKHFGLSVGHPISLSKFGLFLISTDPKILSLKAA